MVLRFQNKLLLAKIESSEGVDASPASTDAVKCANLRPSFNGRVITTDEHTGSLDSDAPLVGGMTIGLSFEVFLKGQGAAATAPEWGKLLKACGMAETITATAVPAAAEALASGSSTTQCTLGASAGTTAEQYRGMPIVFTGTVPGSSFIKSYSAAKLAVLTDTLGGNLTTSTNYQIPINVLYAPSSGTIPSLTLYVYQDGKLLKIVGARGRFRIQLNSGAEGRLFFDFMGMLAEAPSDAAVPASPTFDLTQPPLFKNSVLKLERVATPIQSLSLDCGNTITNPDNPNKFEGFDPAIITKRDLTGSINPLATLVADRDALSDFRAGTQRILHGRLGGSAGNRLGITVPAAQYQAYAEGEREGAMTEELGFKAVGRDAGAFICSY